MAVLIYFTKTQEDEQKIQYHFGPKPQATDRTMIFDKTTGQPSPLDGQEDHQYLAAVRKILLTLDEQGNWPDNGMHMS